MADFTVSPPRFAGSGNVARVTMAQLATLMHDNWATGTMDAKYSLAMAGMSAADFAQFGHRFRRFHSGTVVLCATSRSIAAALR